MEEKLDENVAKELLTILPYLDDEFVNKIPDEFLANLISLAADSSKNFYIKKDKKLEEQNLSEECKSLLSFLYYEFASSTEKNEILNSWIKNDNIEEQ